MRLRESAARPGIGVGDELLKIASERLLASVRSFDTVAYLAGAEFTVLLEGLNEPANAEALAMKPVEAMRPAMRPAMRIGGSRVLQSLHGEAPGLTHTTNER